MQIRLRVSTVWFCRWNEKPPGIICTSATAAYSRTEVSPDWVYPVVERLVSGKRKTAAGRPARCANSTLCSATSLLHGYPPMPSGNIRFMSATSGCPWWSMPRPANSLAKSQKYCGNTPMVEAWNRCLSRVCRHSSSTLRMANALVLRMAR